MSASLVGSEMCIRDSAERAQTAVSSLISEARTEFQAQGSSVGEARAAMEALFASCSEEFQNIRSSQAQVTSAVESLDMKLKNLDNSIGQHLSIFSQRISALEARPTG
eukprot:1741870-Alexandrium_andersonii.AAC.1